MSSMTRSIRRSIERKKGVFVAKKPLREKNTPSVKDMLLHAIKRNSIFKALKARSEAKAAEKKGA